MLVTRNGDRSLVCESVLLLSFDKELLKVRVVEKRGADDEATRSDVDGDVAGWDVGRRRSAVAVFVGARLESPLVDQVAEVDDAAEEVGFLRLHFVGRNAEVMTVVGVRSCCWEFE
ncbi:hypothetical protein QQ045_021574 [Rhodiola kirilowii]